MSNALAGRVSIVTGGMVGIGLATAQALAEQGARVAVGGRRGGDEHMVSQTREILGPNVFIGVLDVCATDSVSAFVDQVEAALGPVDTLVNSAGIGVHQTICGHDEDDWNAVIDTNLNGPYRMIRRCLPGMIDRGWGRIVNIASTAARSAMPDYPAYCASKSGLLGLIPTALDNDPSDGTRSVQSGRRGAQSDASHRSSAGTHRMNGHGPPKAAFSRPLAALWPPCGQATAAGTMPGQQTRKDGQMGHYQGPLVLPARSPWKGRPMA